MYTKVNLHFFLINRNMKKYVILNPLPKAGLLLCLIVNYLNNTNMSYYFIHFRSWFLLCLKIKYLKNRNDIILSWYRYKIVVLQSLIKNLTSHIYRCNCNHTFYPWVLSLAFYTRDASYFYLLKLTFYFIYSILLHSSYSAYS